MEISNAHHKANMSDQYQLEQVLAGMISYPNNNNITMEDTDDHDQLQEEEKKMTRRPPNREHSLKCPRCDSSNTKFCYYNNYSLTQPRYFCKGCRRYWTQGGSLRNVPVGGGCRKNNNNKRLIISSSTNSKKVLPASAAASQQQLLPPNYDGDLSLAANFLNPNPNPNPARSANFLDVLRYGGGAGNFVDSTAHNDNYVDQSVGNNNNMLLFPFEGGHDHDLNLSTTGEAGSWIGSRGNDNNNNNNVAGVDTTTTRDYWNNGVGSSYWHGLINSSNFM